MDLFGICAIPPIIDSNVYVSMHRFGDCFVRMKKQHFSDIAKTKQKKTSSPNFADESKFVI